MKHLTIKEIETELSTLDVLTEAQKVKLKSDERKGVQDLIRRWENRQNQKKKEEELYQKMTQFETDLFQQGYQWIAGIDEAGRGPIAGPVVASAVILKANTQLLGINDSKQLTEARRDYFFSKIMEEAVAVGIGVVPAQKIDEINIYQAAKLAMQKAVTNLAQSPDYLLIDAMTLSLPIPQQSLVKGDSRSISIAAGSIIAKVTRDRMMKEMDQRYPGYGFSKHMGYPTQEHIQALSKLGPCPEHRRSFSPVNAI